MRNLRLLLAYDGTRYGGWQIQANANTIQAELERCLLQITQKPCRVRGAGRTDAGVHAVGQIANFLTETTLSTRRILRGLNGLLPFDISVRAVDEVPLEFDARRDNQGKHYRYRVHNSRERSPERRLYSYAIFRPLDLQRMAHAAAALVGSHDFAAFRAADCERQTTVRTLYRCSISAVGPAVEIDVEGTAFLKHMVRIIAGTLIGVGRGDLPQDITRRLLVAPDRRQAGITAPAAGLCLVRVFL